MNTEKLTQEEKELEQVELLEEFQIEELEQRFEMGWFKNGATVSADVSVGSGGVSAGGSVRF